MTKVKASMAGNVITVIAEEKVDSVRRQMATRAYRASNILRNAELNVLSQQAGHGGRRYRIPGTRKYYTASAPGEVPAVRTGTFRLSWRPRTRISGDVYKSVIESTTKAGKYTLGDILENGTPGGKMAPRPHHDKILQKARPEILRLYEQDYF